MTATGNRSPGSFQVLLSPLPFRPFRAPERHGATQHCQILWDSPTWA